MTKYYPEAQLLLLFLIFFLAISCRQEGATDVTEPDTFTSGVEGPAVDQNGNLYAVNYEKQGAIGKISPDGFSELFLELPEGSIGNGIRFDSQGDMYIADYNGHNVLKVDMDTRKVSVFAHQPAMNQPNDLAIDGKDRLYFAGVRRTGITGNCCSKKSGVVEELFLRLILKTDKCYLQQDCQCHFFLYYHSFFSFSSKNFSKSFWYFSDNSRFFLCS